MFGVSLFKKKISKKCVKVVKGIQYEVNAFWFVCFAVSFFFVHTVLAYVLQCWNRPDWRVGRYGNSDVPN